MTTLFISRPRTSRPRASGTRRFLPVLGVFVVACTGWVFTPALAQTTAASAKCTGGPYDQFDFWLGEWRDVNSKERYAVRRIAEGCAIEEVLYGTIEGAAPIGLSVAGWDPAKGHWRELWVDAYGQVKLYYSEPGADGTFVLTTEPTKDGERWRYVYRNISSNVIDADYAVQSAADGPWRQVWASRFVRIDRKGQ